MKKVVLIFGLLFCVGCDCNSWSRAFYGMGQGMNNAVQMDTQLQQQNSGVIYYPQQQNNSTYWQEQNARQQYFDTIRPKSLFAP